MRAPIHHPDRHRSGPLYRGTSATCRQHSPYGQSYSTRPEYYEQDGYAQPGVVTSPYAAPQGNSGVTIIEYGYEDDGYRRHRPYPPPRYNPYTR